MSYTKPGGDSTLPEYLNNPASNEGGNPVSYDAAQTNNEAHLAPPQNLPDRPSTPNFIVNEGEDGQYRTIAQGKDAVNDYNNMGKEYPGPRPTRPDGKIELTRDMAPEATGFAFPSWKKWYILTVIFIVQVSMNFNTSIYPNATALIPEDERYSGVSPQGARASQMIFLVAYAFGSELWAPWSEEFGRWPVLQTSLFLVNITQVWGAFSPNYGWLLAARFFGGLFTAGGSVTLGMVADLYDSDDHQFAIAYIVLSSVMGTSVGPVIGGFVQNAKDRPDFDALRWIFWLMLIFGLFTQLVHFFTVPETLGSVMLDHAARRRRRAAQVAVHGGTMKRGAGVKYDFTGIFHRSKPVEKGDPKDLHLYGPNELRKGRLNIKNFAKVWFRPFEMIVTEPIVLFLSLLSGFSDALIFTFTMSFELVFKDGWDFRPWAIGLAFVPINLGYVFGFFSFFPTIIHQRRARRRDPDALYPEARLWWLLWLAPLEPIGLFGFAWTSLGNEYNVHWIAPMIFSVLIAIANYAIYMATIDYMVEAYGEYSASATGGNALARDLLAGISAMYAVPMYEKISPSRFNYEWASTFLGFVAIVVILPIYVFYWKGPQIRARSKFSLEILRQKKEIRMRQKGELGPNGSLPAHGETGEVPKEDIRDAGEKMPNNQQA